MFKLTPEGQRLGFQLKPFSFTSIVDFELL